MELIAAARLLARRRWLLLIGLMGAIGLGAVAGGLLPPHHGAASRPSGEALVSALVDTRIPLAATSTPVGAETITQRSVLLADTITGNAWTAQIAKRAGIPAADLSVVGPTFAPVQVNSIMPAGQMPRLAAKAAGAAIHSRYVVNIVNDNAAPLLSIGADAPDVHSAAVLAQATVDTLSAAASATGKARPTVAVRQLGPVKSVAVHASSSKHLLGVIAALAAFLLWCALIVISTGLRRAWKAAGRREPQMVG